MPDLVTHALSAYILASPIKDRRVPLIFVFGSVLPDVLNVLQTIVVYVAYKIFHVIFPDWVEFGIRVTHTPIPLLFVCWTLVFTIPEQHRQQWFIWLVLGSWWHLVLDVMQRHYDTPMYFIFYPFNDQLFEFGLMDTEASLKAIPILIVLSMCVWFWRRWRLKGDEL